MIRKDTAMILGGKSRYLYNIQSFSTNLSKKIVKLFKFSPENRKVEIQCKPYLPFLRLKMKKKRLHCETQKGI